MVDLEKPKAGRPESPTTARELDFDDDDIPASPKAAKSGTDVEVLPAGQTMATESTPPVQPPRPVNVQQEAENTLREAFPSIDVAVVKAVLVASGGRVEPAFNALLGMSDPDAQREPTPPPQPPRPKQNTRAGGQSQVEADALYARQLAEHYNNTGGYSGAPHERGSRTTSREYRGPQTPGPRRDPAFQQQELEGDRERNFIDDDLPIIRDNIRKGFLETQSKVNSLISNLMKRIDGDDEEAPRPTRRTPTGFSSGLGQGNVRRSEETGRRSGDRDRYDADPEVIGDDFTGLNMRDETIPPRSGRPLANPDLFKPTPPRPHSEGRRVSFQDGPPEEIDDLYRASPDGSKQQSATKSKWQPLAMADPSPAADHDPFSLGDSDDDDSKRKEIKMEDAELLTNTTVEAMSDDLGSAGKTDGAAPGGPADGVKDKVAEPAAKA